VGEVLTEGGEVVAWLAPVQATNNDNAIIITISFFMISSSDIITPDRWKSLLALLTIL
jgi:antitoxin (DNA-binding transcriptional repressor) of toxin-antitoxin stability system